jgi:hypothetical protein
MKNSKPICSRDAASALAGKQGSTLTVVLIIMMLTSFMAASMLTLGVHEKDFTYRRIADVEGRHVLESAVEIAMAELQQHFREVQSVTNDAPSVILPSSLVNLLISNTRYITDVRIVDITNRQFRDQVFVNAQDPGTLLDPHRGSFVNVSEWLIRAEADVSYRGQTRVMRASQSFQVRESPFFTHAILYNMDLEFHPGPAMTINGPVHSNGVIWALAGDSLHFLDRVTATEGIHIGSRLDGNQTNWSSGPSSGQNGRRVWFNTNGREPARAERNSAHDRRFANLFNTAGGNNPLLAASYFDSRSEESGVLFSELGFSSMNEFFANWFDSNLATGSIEAPLIRSQFIPNYVADDGNGNRLNFGYSLIEPMMSPLTSDGTPNPFHKGNGEREKFAFKSGLTFEVRHLPGLDISSLTEDQDHWRQLWEPGIDPYPLPHYSQTFNNLTSGEELNGQNGFAVEGSNSNSVTVSSQSSQLPEYESGEVRHNISTQYVRMAPGGNADTGFAHVGFPALAGEEVYFSFVLDIQTAGNNTGFQFGITNTDQFGQIPGAEFHYLRGNQNNSITTTRIGSNLLSEFSRGESSESSALNNQNTVLVVGKLYKTDPDGTFDRAELLLNPSTLERPLTGWQTAAFDTGIGEVDRLFFRANRNAFRMTDIRVGTEYRQVVGERHGATDFWIVPQKVRRSNAFDLDSTDFSPSEQIPLLGGDGLPLQDADGNDLHQTILGVAHDPVYISEEFFHDVFRARLYVEDEDGHPLPHGGFYDKRDLRAMDLVTMDMGAFKHEIVETADLDRFRRPLEDGGSILTYTPSLEFNGVVYFKFPLPEVPPNRPDNILVARDSFREVSTARVDGQSWVQRANDTTALSLHIHNAREIPNPAFNAHRAPGFTLATNSRLYIQGSYNADGLYNTGSPTSADGEDPGHNALAALIADKLTFLSDNFRPENSKRSFNNIPAATFTEVNAALMGGIVPTNTTDYDATRYTPMPGFLISGGSHNFHRFLERWDRGNNNQNRTFRYRGSMVAFYESELSRSFMGQARGRTQGYDWYEAPRRQYGFYDVFGTGAQPPGTPMARTFFKMDFRFE